MTFTAVIGIALAACFNILVDGKGHYGLVRIDRFNAYKTYQTFYTAEVKALAVRRYRPDGVFIGASPTARGIVPECRNSPMGFSRLYNFGGDGARGKEIVANYADLRAVGTIKRMALEARLPNNQFRRADGSLVDASPSPPQAEGLIADIVRPWLPAQHWSAYIANLLSWHELILNAQTVASNLKADRSFLFYGFDSNGAYDQVWLRRWEAWVITEEALASHIKNYFIFLVTKVTNDMAVDYSYVETLAAKAGPDGVAIDLFVTPEHVTELLLYYESGIWPLYEKFKRTVLQAAEEARRRHHVTTRVFDFGTLNDAVAQPIREVGRREEIYDPYFGDPVHYRKSIGDFILATMYGCRVEQAPPAGFGIELTAANIDAHLADQKAKLEAYRIKNPELVEKINVALRN